MLYVYYLNMILKCKVQLWSHYSLICISKYYNMIIITQTIVSLFLYVILFYVLFVHSRMFNNNVYIHTYIHIRVFLCTILIFHYHVII